MTEIVCSRDSYNKATGEIRFSTWGVLKVWFHGNRVCWDWDSTSGSGPFSVNPETARKIAAVFTGLADDIDAMQAERAAFAKVEKVG